MLQNFFFEFESCASSLTYLYLLGFSYQVSYYSGCPNGPNPELSYYDNSGESLVICGMKSISADPSR